LDFDPFLHLTDQSGDAVFGGDFLRPNFTCRILPVEFCRTGKNACSADFSIFYLFAVNLQLQITLLVSFSETGIQEINSRGSFTDNFLAFGTKKSRSLGLNDPDDFLAAATQADFVLAIVDPVFVLIPTLPVK
jgi:hypothetical protein